MDYKTNDKMDFCEAWKWLVQMVILEVRRITLAYELCPRTAESRLTTFKLFLKRVTFTNFRKFFFWNFLIFKKNLRCVSN